MHLSHFLLLFPTLKIPSFKDTMPACSPFRPSSPRGAEELPCQSPQGLGRPSAPRQGCSGSRGALNSLIPEANGRNQRSHISQGGPWRKEACWSGCRTAGKYIYHPSESSKMKGRSFCCSVMQNKKIRKSKIQRTTKKKGKKKSYKPINRGNTKNKSFQRKINELIQPFKPELAWKLVTNCTD